VIGRIYDKSAIKKNTGMFFSVSFGYCNIILLEEINMGDQQWRGQLKGLFSPGSGDQTNQLRLRLPCIYLLVLPPPISWPSLYPAILSHSIFCLVIGNCLRKPLKAPSLRLLKPLLTSSWYFFSATVTSRIIDEADAEDIETEIGLVVKSRTFPSS